MSSPSQTTFWRAIFIFTLLLAAFSIFDSFQLAQNLGVSPFASKTILGMLAFFTLTVFTIGAGLTLTFTAFCQKFFSWLEAASRAGNNLRFTAYPALALVLAAFPLIFAQTAVSKLLRETPSIRFFVFWLIALAAMNIFRLAWRSLSFPVALAAAMLSMAAVNIITSYFPAITDYPFALGWSETSRFYFPSLFLSEKIYGQAYPWPILHPSLHLLLTPPYWFDAPLWAHRAWQVAIRFLMVGLIATALLSRFRVENRALRWLAGLWMFVFLFDISIYLHLPLMIFPILWLYRPGNDRRAWALLVFASIWAGLSRLNWYPMPGLILAALYWLEDDRAREKTPWRAFLFPCSLAFAGSLIAFFTARVYIALSGVAQDSFFTSLTSDLLWYRLWPNATYWLGVLPGILLISLPLWAVLFYGKRLEPAKAWLLGGILAILFVGGIFVSMKIGGGADIHNMDAYAVMLLVLAAYAFFRASKPIPWQVIALLVLVPAWFGHKGNSGLARYDQAASQATLTALQQRVDSTEGEILFITQRHLISMRMLHNVPLIPEYEREDLMEMAMAGNRVYLEHFARDIESQRFAAIIVDPLKFNLLGSAYEMGEENNAWARRVVKPVLCWYREDQVFPTDKIVIYVPREEGKNCP
jgi:hypothetical protein